MFEKGDLIVYGLTGVCRVISVGMLKEENSDSDALYYELEPIMCSYTIKTPVNNSKVFIRPVISKEEALHLIDLIPTMKVKTYHSKVIRQLSEHYSSAIESHSTFDLIKLSMSIYTKKKEAEVNHRKIGATDQKFMKKAEELLFSELAAALKIEPSEVPMFIETYLSEKTSLK